MRSEQTIDLRWGRSALPFAVPDAADLLQLREPERELDPAAWQRGLANVLPDSIPAGPVCVVVADKTRLCGYPLILPRLLAALAGAEYVAPYVNRVDAQGGDGIRMVQELQTLLELHAPQSKVLAASFKTPRQALDCLLAGCEAITLPLDVAQQMLGTPAVESAIEKFEQDWKNAFGNLNL